MPILALKKVRGPLLNLYRPTSGDDCGLWLPGQDDAYSAVIRDRSGNNNNGAITGTDWKRTGAGLWYLDSDADCYAIVTRSASIEFADNFTFKFWYYNKGHTGTTYVFSKGSSNATAEYEAYITAAENLVFSINAYAVSLAGMGIGENVWTHLVFTYDKSLGSANLTGYENAETPVTANYTTSITAQIAQNLGIGARGSTASPTNANLALFLAMGRTWSAAEVTANYNQDRHLFGV